MGGFKGGSRGLFGGRPSLRDSTTCLPKGPPFGTFQEIHFLPIEPKSFLKAPWAPIYTNFEGERALKKRNFFFKIFQKVFKNGFFDLFFQKFACGADNLAKTGTF